MTRTVPARFIAASNTASGSGASGSTVPCSFERPPRRTITGLVRAAVRNAEMKLRASRTHST